MRVLITNLFVKNYSGSENVVELLAEGLRRAGHQPVLFAPELGEQAQSMRQRGFRVVDRAAQLTELPDVIHAQHLTPCLIAMARFPNAPVVYSCHSSVFDVEAPLPHPQIREVIAVDERCAAKCREVGVPSDRLSVILNAVDLERFRRRALLPDKPKRALLLTKNRGHRDGVRTACANAGIDLDELGRGTNRFVPAIETVLGDYDLVFATARMAIEAAATGCSVIVCDERGFAGMLTSGNFPVWRPLNFGVGILLHTVTVGRLAEAISQYNAADAGIVTDMLRNSVSAELFVKQHLEVYRRAIESPAPPDEQTALATAFWTEELAVTRTDRKWKAIAKELVIYEQLKNPEQDQASAEAFAEIGSQLAVIKNKVDTIQLSVNAAVKRIDHLSENRTTQLTPSLPNVAKEPSGRQFGRRLKQALIPKSIRKRMP